MDLVGTLEKPELKEGEKCPLVIIMHGFTANRQELMHVWIAQELLKNHIASVRFDFNGHGESDGMFEDMTVMNEVEDAMEILRYAKKLDFVESISILGHSQGGVVAGMTAGYYPDEIACPVQMAPAATLKDDAIKGTIMGVQYDPDHIPEYVIFGNIRLSRLYFGIAQHLPIYEVSSQYRGPVCLIHGTSDYVVSYTASKKYQEIYTDSELHLLEGQDHCFMHNLDEAVVLAVDFIVAKAKQIKYNF
ncbi:MAG TPA: alpha/beta fold hydrolase [Clostridium sp.]|uniref:alpha/beta hydrolase family protein n=1 Tax=Clostridium sp. TaxID=1506 RepID=UPI002F943715